MFVKCDNDFDDIIQKHELPVVSDSPDGTQLKVTEEKQAQLF